MYYKLLSNVGFESVTLLEPTLNDIDGEQLKVSNKNLNLIIGKVKRNTRLL